MPGNVVRLPQRRPPDLIAEAMASGKPLPLDVMLNAMWRLLEDAERLEATNNPDNAMVARVARDRALRVAEMAAPYVHPRKSTATIGGDPTNPITHVHRFDAMSDSEVRRHLDAVIAGQSLLELLQDAETS
jgi:hypothetical protein